MSRHEHDRRRRPVGGRPGRVASAVCLGAVLGGCGVTPGPASSSGVDAERTHGGPEVARTYECQGTPVPSDVLTRGRPLDELPAPAREALTEAGVAEDGLWTVVATEPELIALRRLAEPDDRTRPGATHAMVRLSPSADGTMEEPVPGEPWVWRVSGSTHCAIRLAGGLEPVSGLVWADLALDPARPPEASAREVTVLARFPQCSDETDVAGPWRVVHLAEAADTIEVVVAADPAPLPPGPVPQPCRASDAVARVVLELAAPLGDRALVDPTVLPHGRVGPVEARP